MTGSQETMSDTENYETIPCSECQAGKMRRQFITYLTWLGEELVTVPDFPAWVCDICGRREYDGSALNRLALILSPNAGKPPTRFRKAPFTRDSRKPSQPPPTE